MRNSLTLFFGALLLAGCGARSPEAAISKTPAAKVVVRAAPAALQEWAETYEATGTVRARTAAVISAKLMGYVREVRVQTGDHVSERQLLMRLDARDLDAAFERAKAAHEEILSNIGEAESNIAAARAGADLAQATFNRMQEMHRKKSISDQELDEVSARLKAAQAAYQIACARQKQMEARLAQVEQEVQAAHVNRSFAEIVAPFAGVCTSKSVEPGNLAVPGAPLLTIERDGSYRLEVSVEESRLAAIHGGQVVSVRLDAVGQSLSARVSEIVPAVDAATHASIVKIDLPPVPKLRSGLFGRAEFSLASRRVIPIPDAAVTTFGQLQSVFTVDNGQARTRLVTLGRKNQDLVEVLSGLSAGDEVIFPVPPGLQDGAGVEVRP